jgi:hypothetical protein
MTARGPVEYVRANEEKFRLVAYVAVMGGLAIPLSGLLRRAWTAGPGNLSRTVVQQVATVGPGLAVLQAVAAGLLVTLATLMVLDRTKRIQGVLIWLALVLVVAGMLLDGFVPRLFAGEPHWVGLSFGAVVGLAVAVPRSVVRAVSRIEVPTTLEFRRAPTALFVLTVVPLVVAAVEANVTYPSVGVLVETARTGGLGSVPRLVESDWVGVVADGTVVALFAGVTHRFVSYERTTSVMVLGPSGAGKTYLLYAAYLEWQQRRSDHSTLPVDADDQLLSLVEDAETTDVVTSDGVRLGRWELDNTTPAETGELGFTIQDGRVFPRALRIESLDYTGEALSDLAAVVGGSGLGPEAATPADTIEELHERVEAADALVFLVDVARFDREGASLDVAAYTRFVQAYRDDKQLLFAATKADRFGPAYDRRRQRDIYATRNLDDLARFVTGELRESTALRGLLDQAGVDTVHPVYLETKVHDGDRLPVLRDGQPTPFGFVRLLEQFR